MLMVAVPITMAALVRIELAAGFVVGCSRIPQFDDFGLQGTQRMGPDRHSAWSSGDWHFAVPRRGPRTDDVGDSDADGISRTPTGREFAWLIGTAVVFVVAVNLLRRLIAGYVIPFFASLRSVELVVLFAVLVLAGTCWMASALDCQQQSGRLLLG